MSTHIHKTHMKPQHTIGEYWLWLSLGVVLIVATLVAYQNINQRKEATTILNTTTVPIAQSVPDAASQGIANYIRAHSNPYVQAVPNAADQGVTNYLQVHRMPSAQIVADPAVQSVMDYIRLHGMAEPIITDPAVKSVMDYLKAHGIQP